LAERGYVLLSTLLFVVAMILVLAGGVGMKNTFFVAPIEYFYISLGLTGLGICLILGLLMYSSIMKYKSTGRFWGWQTGLFIFILLPIAFFALRTIFYNIFYSFN